MHLLIGHLTIGIFRIMRSSSLNRSNREIVVVLPDIRSAHNTGAFFRTADACGVSKIFICGYTAPPPHKYIAKVSLGAEDAVPWEYVEEVEDVIDRLHGDGFQVIAVEQTAHSIDYRGAEYSNKVALIFGNEVRGLSTEVTDQCDLAVELPMAGVKQSVNVSVCGGVMLYALAYQL